uniref:Uncharacterized protein n=1 Tax=Arundo donax TaxID=35708 RepID=A0A0A9C7J0_ARUDO
MRSLSFLPRPRTTEVRVRSVEEPGPQPGSLRLAALARSRASSLPLTALARRSTCSTSASMRARRTLTARESCAVLLSSCADCSRRYSASSPRMSSFTPSTSSKNLSRSAPSPPRPPPPASRSSSAACCFRLAYFLNDPDEKRSFISPESSGTRQNR